MKRFYKFLMPLVAIVAMALPWTAKAQELGDYTFSTDTSSEVWFDMSTATQILTPSGNDGLASSLQNIGFSFPFGDGFYTQFSVNTDGNLRLGSIVTGTGSYSTPFNASNASTNNPKINAFGCDGYGNSGTNYVKSLLTEDDNGDTVLVVEFCMGTYTTSTRSNLYKWQIHLYANGDIVIAFPDANGIPATAPAVSHQCGMCVDASDGWVISSSTNTATHFTAGSSTTNASGTWFDANRYYRFTRPIVTCPKPATAFLTDLNAFEAYVSWEYGGTESEWEVTFGDTVFSTSDTFYTFTGLTPNTNYTVGIRAICGTDDTSAARVLSFRTPCDMMPLPYSINFDSVTTSTTAATGVAVPCWDYTMLNPSYATSSYWPQIYRSTSYANSSPYCVRLYGVAYVSLPPMEAPVDSLQISFSHYTTSTSYDMQVGVLEADGTFVPLYTVDDPASSHVSHTFYLNNYTGNSHTIAFYNYYANSTTGYSYHYIDDVVVDYLPTCSPVTDVHVEATVGAAVVSWTAGVVGNYSGAYVEYKADTATTWESATTTNLSVALTGLSSQTDYTVRVKAICDDSDTVQDWVTATFSTGSFGCAIPDTSLLDTIAIGNGTTTSYYVPIGNYYNYSYTQQLITSDELHGATTFSGIDFQYSYSTASSVKTNVTIYMANVSATSLSSSFVPYSSAFQQVYSGPMNCTQGWNHFEFDTPFSYDGTSNLLIVVHDNSGDYDGSSYTFYCHSATGKARYIQNDSSPYDITSVGTGTSYANRANMKLYAFGCLVPATCAAPAAAIAAVDTSSVTISWVPGASETSWEVWYREGSTGPFVVADASVTDLTYTFENLIPGTKYYFRVVNICDPDTFYSEVNTYTDCAPIDSYFDDFQGFAAGAAEELNPCWYRGIYNETTNYPYVNTVDGNKVLYFYSYLSGGTHRYCWLSLPETRDSVNLYEIEFDMRKYSTTTYYGTRIIVGVMTNPANIATFDTIATFDATIAGVWESFHLSLADYHGEGKYITLLAPDIDPASLPGNTATYSYNYVYLDNLYVGRISSCPKPTRFHARDITANTAELAWDDNENYVDLNIKWGTVNSISAATDSTVVSTGNSYALSGLSANTTYYCWITAVCDDDISRTMSCSFTTGNPCEPVTNLSVSDLSIHSAFITWASNELTPATSYVFEWKADTAVAWNTVSTANTFYYISGLDSATNYMVRVTAECNSDTAMAATVTFTTPAPGTIGQNEGTYYIPTYPYYNHSISEQLWLANELAEYGDTINGIYFNAASAIDDRPMKIWVCDTTLDNLTTSSYVPSTSMTLVMDSTYDITAGWNYFPFSTPFVRTANMVVLVTDNADYETFSGWYATTSAVNSLYDYDDDVLFSTTDLSGLNVEGVRAIMRLDAPMVPVTCMAPHAVVSNTTDTSVTVIWVPGMNETAWSVEYKGLSDTAWTVVSASQTDTFATVGGLMGATTYMIRIGALCGSQTMYATVRGTTQCGSFTVPYFEDFNAYASGDYGFDPCWYRGNAFNTNMPYIVNLSGGIGPSVLMPQGSYIIFPQMDVPVNMLQLRVQYLVARDDIYALVGVCSHPRDILSMTVIDTLWGPNVGETNWNTITLDSYTGTDGYIVIYSSYNQSYIDNVNIEMIPQCGVVDSIEATNITTASATISWMAGSNGGSYIVEYGITGDSVMNTVAVTTPNVNLTGLVHSTTYTVNVYTICPTLNDTSVAATYRFTTECDIVSLPYVQDFDHCNAPALTLTGILPNCWNYAALATSTSYNTGGGLPQIYSGTSYASSGQYSMRMYGQAIVLLPEMPTDVDSLMLSFHEYNSSPAYYGLIIGVCDSNTPGFEASWVPVDTLTFSQAHTNVTTYNLAAYAGTGRYIGFKNFYINSTNQYSYHYIDDVVVDYLPSCLPVVNVHSSASTSNSIDLTWTDLRPATEWQVSYSTTPLTDPSTGNVSIVTSNPCTFTGLSSDTSYYFYVRVVCAPGDTSIWSNGISVRPGTYVMRANATDTVSMCGGTIYDDGGENGSYSNSQNSYLIVMPSGSNIVSISGTLNSESCCDSLVIYDGIGTANRLWGGKGTGITIPEQVSSTGPLTIYFRSDGSVNNSGYELHVNCVSNACPITDIHVDTTAPATTTTVTLAWTGTSTGYEVEYGRHGFARGTGNTVTTSTNSVTVNTLEAMAVYDFYVRGFCMPDTSRWFNFVYTTPMCDNAFVVENWDSTMTATTSSYSPIGYSFYNYSYVQTIIDSADMAAIGGDITAIGFHPSTTESGTYFTNMDVYMANVSQSTLSSFITPSATTPFVHVISAADFTYNNTDWQVHGFDSVFTWDGHSNVLVAVNRGHGDYESGASFRAHTHSGTKMCYAYNDGSPYSITSPGSPSSSSNTVGDIRLYSCGAYCPMPALSSLQYDHQSATINVTGGSNYDLVYGTDIAAMGDTMSNSNGIFNISGLMPATQYFYGVRQHCDSAAVSNWYVGSFTTDSLPCFVPDSLTVVATTYNSATISWSSNATAWEVHVVGSGLDRYDTARTNPYTITNLYQGTEYTVTVRSLCMIGVEESDFSAPLTVRTNDCNMPEGVTVSNITATTADVSWQAVAGAQGYKVYWGEPQFIFAQVTPVPVTGTSYTITGLEAESPYEVVVVTRCTESLEASPTANDRIGFNTTTGIYDVESGTLTLYPNPATTSVSVNVTGTHASSITIEIVDLNGRTVYKQNSSDSQFTIDVSSLAQGAYFVRVTSEQQTAVRKLIVK